MVTGQNTKMAAIVALGAGEEVAEVKEVAVHPGMTVGEVLEQIGLKGYRLSRGKGTPLLDDGDNLYAELKQDGEKLYASTLADQGDA